MEGYMKKSIFTAMGLMFFLSLAFLDTTGCVNKIAYPVVSTPTPTATAPVTMTVTPTMTPTYKIVYESTVASNDGIFVMNWDGSNAVRLTGHNGVDLNPRFNIGQTKIVWNSEYVNNWAIWVMYPDGTSQTQLTNLPGTTPSYQDRRPCWSPDGTKIAFSSSRAGTGWFEVFTMNSDGTNVTQLTSDADTDDQPSWSPDGTKIAYVAGADIVVMSATGGSAITLTNTNNNSSPCWSVDGTHIAFTSSRSGTSQNYVMNADGTNVTDLSNNTYLDTMPLYTPDSLSILFYSYDRPGGINGDPEVYRMNVNGSNQVDLTGTTPSNL
jgi:Tol biopolymer transport system component